MEADDDADSLNLYSFQEFLDMTLDNPSGMVEVVASGVAGPVSENSPVNTTASTIASNDSALDLSKLFTATVLLEPLPISDLDMPQTENPRSVVESIGDPALESEADEDEDETLDDAEDEPVDEHGFTESDYAYIAENFDLLEILSEDDEHHGDATDHGKVNDLSTNVGAKMPSEFPLEPSGMTIEFLHEWVSSSGGRIEELEAELFSRLKDSFEELLLEGEGKQIDENQETIATLLNSKLETCAKLGLLEEIKTMATKYENNLDFCQVDRCGLPLFARLCIWPCNDDSHIYCQIIEFLILKCNDPNVVDKCSSSSGTTALMIAAKLGEKCKVNVLLKFGASVNVETDDGRTALILAAERGHFEIVIALLANGANPCGSIFAKPTALEFAAQNDHIDIARRIMKHSANLSEALRSLCDGMFGGISVIETPVTPVFCTTLHESTVFAVEFVPDPEAFEDKPDHLNMMFVACVENDKARKSFRCRPNTAVKTVRLNGLRQDSVIGNGDVIKVTAMVPLKCGVVNSLKLRLKRFPKTCTAKILMQGFVCDMSKFAAKALRNTPPPPSPLCLTPNNVQNLTPMPEDESEFWTMTDRDGDILDEQENMPPSAMVDYGEFSELTGE